MILELDIGNTRIKWRYVDDQDRVSATRYAAGIDQLEEQLADQASVYTFCRVSAVRSAQDSAGYLQKALARYVLGNIVYAVSSESLAGVENGYASPGQLGVDRWLGVVAGYQIAMGACIVIDAGTAITVDLIGFGGKHLGGLIAPGYKQLVSLLTGSTGLAVQEQTAIYGPQTDTSSCLAAGVFAMLESFIQGVCQNGFKILGPKAQIIISGGDAPMIQAMIPEPSLIVDELVFSGLALACPV